MINSSICLVSPFAGNALYGGNAAGGGGAERQLVMIGRGLADAGWKVHFIIGTHIPKGEIVDPRFTVSQVPFRYLGGSKWHLLPDSISLILALKKAGALLVGIRGGGHYLLRSLIFYKCLFKTKIVVWLQHDHDVFPDMYYPNENTWLRKLPKHLYTNLLKKADFLIAQTETQKAVVESHLQRKALTLGSLAPERKGVREISPSSTKGYVLWAGNVSPNKRVELVIELAKRLPEIQFVIAMSNNGGNRAEMVAAEAARSKNINYLGSVPPQAMEGWFDNAICVLNTSVGEGFPNTFLQAWERGIPVVSAGVNPGGVLDNNGLGVAVLVDGKSEGQIEKLAQALEKICLDVEGRAAMQKTAREYLRKNHSPAEIFPRLHSALGQLISSDKLN